MDIENGAPKGDLRPDKVMTGEERYSLMGDLMTEDEATEIMKRCRGFHFYGDCLRKNIVAHEVLSARLGGLLICMGALEVRYGTASYGFLFNLPNEFHAFLLQKTKFIIDVSLPGVIQRAQQHSDEQGVWLDGLEPRIIAGDPVGFPGRYHYVVNKALTYEEAVYFASMRVPG